MIDRCGAQAVKRSEVHGRCGDRRGIAEYISGCGTVERIPQLDRRLHARVVGDVTGRIQDQSGYVPRTCGKRRRIDRRRITGEVLLDPDTGVESEARCSHRAAGIPYLIRIEECSATQRGQLPAEHVCGTRAHRHRAGRIVAGARDADRRDEGQVFRRTGSGRIRVFLQTQVRQLGCLRARASEHGAGPDPGHVARGRRRNVGRRIAGGCRVQREAALRRHRAGSEVAAAIIDAGLVQQTHARRAVHAGIVIEQDSGRRRRKGRPVLVAQHHREVGDLLRTWRTEGHAIADHGGIARARRVHASVQQERPGIGAEIAVERRRRRRSKQAGWTGTKCFPNRCQLLLGESRASQYEPPRCHK